MPLESFAGNIVDEIRAENADGTEPIDNQRTSVQLTVRAWMCTPPPIGFNTNDATTSEEIAADGVTWKKITSIGVMSAPPPMPVRPMTHPTINDANAMFHCIADSLPNWSRR